MECPLIATDVDHSMLGPRLEAGEVPRVISLLQLVGSRIVLVTAKTLEETVLVAELVGIDPGSYVAAFENSGAVAAAEGLLPDPDYTLPPPRPGWPPVEVRELAPRLHEYADQALEAARSACPEAARIEDVDPRVLAELTGLPLDHAEAARARRYGLVLWAPSRECLARAAEALSGLGYNVALGAKFLHVYLHGGKREAIRYLRRVPWASSAAIVAVGDSPIDEGMLEEADMAVVVPRGWAPRVRPRRDYVLAPQPAPDGWVSIIEEIILNMC